jgi:hypothetical protein
MGKGNKHFDKTLKLKKKNGSYFLTEGHGERPCEMQGLLQHQWQAP